MTALHCAIRDQSTIWSGRGVVVLRTPGGTWMKQVEYWYWRYRSPDSRRKSKTLLPMTAMEAAHLPEAERIPGTMLLRDVEEGDFEDTSPGEPLA